MANLSVADSDIGDARYCRLELDQRSASNDSANHLKSRALWRATLNTGNALVKIHQLSVDAALDSLCTTADGLSAAEAERRLSEYGPNRIEKMARTPAALRLLREFVQFFSVILWVAAALAFVAEWSAPGQGMARIGYALIGVILVSGIFSFWQEYRVEQTLDALQKLLPRQVSLLRGGSQVGLAIEQLVPGDFVLLEAGDRLRTRQGCRVRHRRTHRVRQDRASRPNERRGGFAVAQAACLFEPIDRGSRNWHRAEVNGSPVYLGDPMEVALVEMAAHGSICAGDAGPGGVAQMDCAPDAASWPGDRAAAHVIVAELLADPTTAPDGNQPATGGRYPSRLTIRQLRPTGRPRPRQWVGSAVRVARRSVLSHR